MPATDRAEVEPGRAAVWGLCLDAVAAHVAESAREGTGPQEESEAGAPRLAAVAEEPIPPAVLLPRFVGEPVAVDLGWPPHPRGTGDTWPPEAHVEAGHPPGRFPLGYAWPMLQLNPDAPPWRWRHGRRESRLRPAEAIARIVDEAMRRCGAGEDGSAVGLVAGSHLSKARQTELLEHIGRRRCGVRLIPRPAAAAMLWCEQFAGRIETAGGLEAGDVVGGLMAMHFGLDVWEAAIVELALSPGAPGSGRRRLTISGFSAPAPPLASYGLELMHQLAGRALDVSYRRVSVNRVWELLWCTPWMQWTVDLLTGRTNAPMPLQLRVLAPHVLTAEFAKQQHRFAAQQILGGTVETPGLIREYLPPSPRFTDLRDWVAALRNRSDGARLIGAVATGPMAAMPHERGAIGDHYVKQVWPAVEQIVLEGRELPAGSLARGAALMLSGAAA